MFRDSTFCRERYVQYLLWKSHQCAPLERYFVQFHVYALDPGLRFINGQFVMIGLIVNDKPLMRAYSIVSPNYEDQLEFYSIKVQDGPLTSRLQHLKVGDEVTISKKATGTLRIYLLPGKKPISVLHGYGLWRHLCRLSATPMSMSRYENHFDSRRTLCERIGLSRIYYEWIGPIMWVFWRNGVKNWFTTQLSRASRFTTKGVWPIYWSAVNWMMTLVCHAWIRKTIAFNLRFTLDVAKLLWHAQRHGL